MNIDLGKRVGPYVGVSRDEKVAYDNGKTLRFVLYGAYDAYGLIGSEYNGILILDEDRKVVVADNIAKESSGYNGPSTRQTMLYDSLLKMGWDAFVAMLNECDTSRFRFVDGEWVDNPDVRR